MDETWEHEDVSDNIFQESLEGQLETPMKTKFDSYAFVIIFTELIIVLVRSFKLCIYKCNFNTDIQCSQKVSIPTL